MVVRLALWLLGRRSEGRSHGEAEARRQQDRRGCEGWEVGRVEREVGRHALWQGVVKLGQGCYSFSQVCCMASMLWARGCRAGFGELAGVLAGVWCSVRAREVYICVYMRRCACPCRVFLLLFVRQRWPGRVCAGRLLLPRHQAQDLYHFPLPHSLVLALLPFCTQQALHGLACVLSPAALLWCWRCMRLCVKPRPVI